MTQRSSSAVFVARAWWEGDRFRARLTYCTDIDAGPGAETSIVTADAAEIRQLLASWLDAFTTPNSA